MALNDKESYLNVTEELVSDEEIIIIKEEYFKEDPEVIDTASAVDNTSESSAREYQLSKSITNDEDKRVMDENNFNVGEEVVISEEDIVIIKEEYFEEDPEVIGTASAVDNTSESSAREYQLSKSITNDEDKRVMDENNFNVGEEVVISEEDIVIIIEEYFEEDPEVIDTASAVGNTSESSAREYQLSKSITNDEDKRVMDENNFNVGEEVVISEEDIVIIKEEYFEEDPEVIDTASAVGNTSESSAREYRLSKSITNYEDKRVMDENNFNVGEEVVISEEDIVILKEEYFEEDPVIAEDHTIEYSAKDKRVNGNMASDTLNVKYYACNECGKQFHEKKQLSTHYKTHFICDLCNRTFTLKSTFESHMSIHTEKRWRYACDVCDKKFFYKSQFMMHNKQIHNEGLTCDVCKKKLWHKHTLASHMRTHTGEKPYECNICGISYSHNSTLVAHKRTHTGQKPYACCICEKNFSQKSYLKAHLRTHTGVQPFVCSICDKKYKQKANLNVHLRIHTGVKDYACDKCEMKFTNSSSLCKHKKTHNRKKISKGLTKLKEAQASVSQLQETESHESLEAMSVHEKHSTEVHVKHEFVTSEEENPSDEYIIIKEEFVKEEPVVTAVDVFAVEQPINRYL